MVFRAASDISENETKQNQTKQKNKNEECECDGSQKSIWKQICQQKNVAERVRPGNLRDASWDGASGPFIYCFSFPTFTKGPWQQDRERLF